MSNVHPSMGTTDPVGLFARLDKVIPRQLRSVIFCVFAAAVGAAALAAGHEAPRPSHALWAVGIGLSVFLAESFPIHILYRREATSFSLFEVPLIVGIFVLPGWQLLAAMVLGVTAALTIVRKQPIVKVLFNVSNLVLHGSVATLIFDVVGGTRGLGPVGALAGLIASAVGSLLASSTIAWIIRRAEGALETRKTIDMLAFSLLVGISNASLAMIALKLGSAEPWSIALLALPLAVATAAYRAFVSERHQREQLQFLLSATKSLSANLGRSDSFEALLSETAAMFRASRVELVIFDNADAVEAPLHCSFDSDGIKIVELHESIDSLRNVAHGIRTPLHLSSHVSTGSLAKWLDSLSVQDVIVAPLRSDSEDIGLFMVADRVGAVSTFAHADLELFSTLSLQVATALENDRLGQALTQLRKLEGELSHLAVHDTLTGLPNRLGLRRHLEKVTSEDPVNLLFLDLDDFKIVNDTLGHASGDELLMEVADRIRASLRDDDFAARLGGDEFAICLPDLSSAMQIAERIVESIAQPIVIDGNEVRVGCSIGSAMCEPGLDVATMLRRADVAMYSAKGAGKNRVRSYTDELDERVIDRQRLLTKIQTAVTNDEFRVHYQPIFGMEAGDGTAIGAEALVRWQTPDGLLAPGEFLPLAEESDLIVAIDRWVFNQVIADAGSYPALDWVSVNLSARHVLEDDVVEWIIAATEAGAVDPSRIVLEITETAVMVDMESSIVKLAQLREAGFGLALDDFGTGYSSIAYLRQLPFTMLKVAQPFVADMNSSGNPPFVRAIIDLAHTLGLPVIAEGVETLEQLSTLRSLGCDLAQGYLLARPAELNNIIEGRITAS